MADQRNPFDDPPPDGSATVVRPVLPPRPRVEDDLFGDGRPAPQRSAPPPPRTQRTGGVGGADASGVGGGGSGGPLAAGTVLSSTFEIEVLVARGGMGEVYRARHRITGDLVAIKTIRPELAGDPKVAELFKREALALRNLRHPAIVSYEGVFDDGTGALFLAMEYVDGPSLSKVMQAGPIAAVDVRRLRDRLASGLAVAHAQGVVHRDLSPDNVILPGGRLDDAKLIDFGIAKQTEGSKATIIGTDFAGKYAYAAPEQLGMFSSEVGPQADIYSLGLVLAGAAMGAPIDMGNSPGAAVQARQSVPDLAKAPADIRDNLAAMLQPDPARRARSMADLVGLGVKRGGATTGGARAGGGKTGLVVALLALVVVAGAGGGAWVFRDTLFPKPTVPTGDPRTDPTPKQPGYPSTPGTGSTTSATPPTVTPPTVEPKVEPTPKVPVVPRGPDVAAIRGLVDAELRRYTCAGLTATVDPQGGVRVEGYVSTDKDRAQLQEALRALPGVASAVARLSVQPWPICELNRVVASYSSPDFRVVPNRPDTAYKIGRDNLSFRVVVPGSRGGLLNVVIINSDGTVTMPQGWSRMANQPGSVVPFGEQQKGFVLEPPGGKMVMVAVLTSTPLFSGPRPEEEPTNSYLAALTQALSQHSDALATFTAIDTSE